MERNRLLFRVSSVVLGSVLAVVGLELALRAGAALVGPRLEPASDLSEGATVLAVGDSYTYGVFYSAEQSYPGQLQEILDRRRAEPVRVVNVGLPGMSSAEVVSRFSGWCETYRPTVAIVCVGINNLWNRSAEGRSGWTGHLLAGSRVVRLARLLFMRPRDAASPEAISRPNIRRVLLDGGQSGVEHRDRETGDLLIRHEGAVGQPTRTLDEARGQLRRDLETLRRQSEWWGVRLHLLTYPVPPSPADEPLYAGQRAMNQELVDFAVDEGLGLTDPQLRFSEAMPSGSQVEQLFHSGADSHPNPAGYRLVALALADSLDEP